LRDWRQERRREKQRREVIAKHTKKAAAGEAPPPRIPAPPPPIVPEDAAPAKPAKKRITDTVARAIRRAIDDEDEAPDAQAGAGAGSFGSTRPVAPAKPPKVNLPAAMLPLTDPEPISKAPAERRKGDYTLPPLALLDASKAERKIDERELMDGAR